MESVKWECYASTYLNVLSCRAYNRQRLLQVGDQIIRVLNSD